MTHSSSASHRVSWLSIAVKPLILTALILLAPWADLMSMRQISAQTAGLTEADREMLKAVIPEADSFSEKSGELPVFRAYQDSPNGGEPTLVGYAFMTPDYPPEEIGYSAPIEMLAGMDMEGNLTGIKVLYYRESYESIRGDFLDNRRFLFQFKNKPISDGFRVGRDVDGVSRATITSWAMSRGLRNAARRVALAYLSDADYVTARNTGATAIKALEQKSWQDMKDEGFVNDLIIPLEDKTELRLSIAYIGNEQLGELMVGSGDYSRAERDASNRVMDGTMVMVGIDGDASKPFRQENLALQQGGEIYPLPRRRFVYLGSADVGKIADQVRFAGAIVMDSSIDVTKPFTVHYNMPDTGIFSSDYTLSGAPLALAEGRAFPSGLDGDEFDDEFSAFEDESVFARLINEAPWTEVFALLVLFAMVMFSFLRKNATARWVTLAATLVYLGFMDGGFLSVSHITNGIKLGPSLFLNDLPLLLLVIFTLVTTVFWGRVFCSSLCPFGALQDFLTRIVPARYQRTLPQAIHDNAIYLKSGILALLVIMALGQSELSIFQYFEPFGTIFYRSTSIVLWFILIVILLASAVVNRFYCRYACPLGASLGLISMVSPLRIERIAQCDVCKVCEFACPTAAIRGPAIDFKECVRCDICEIKLIATSGVCKHSMETVRARHKNWEQPVAVGG